MATGKVWFELRYQHSIHSANVYIVRKASKI